MLKHLVLRPVALYGILYMLRRHSAFLAVMCLQLSRVLLPGFAQCVPTRSTQQRHEKALKWQAQTPR